IEFQITGSKPEPWTPEVCLTRMAGYVMTRHASTEVLRSKLAVEFSRDMVLTMVQHDLPLKYAKEMGSKAGLAIVAEWIETDPPSKLKLPQGLAPATMQGIDHTTLAAAKDATDPVTVNPNDGSNNRVIAGQMWSTGNPILA